MDPNFKLFLTALVDKLPEIFDKEGFQYYTYNNRVSFSCPIHGSNRRESASIFTTESQFGLIGNWKCFTHGCESETGKSVYNFLVEYFCIAKNWTKQQSKKYVGSLVDVKKVDYNVSNYEFVQQVQILQKPIIDYKQTFDKSVLNKLHTPSNYYKRRGFKEDVLKKFSVGDCLDHKAKFRHRSIIPVFDNKYDKVINFIARSVYEKCMLCGYYHEPSTYCPITDSQKYYTSKWLNFSTLGNAFYNIWNAKPNIEETNECVLVESASDIWRLEECGIQNCLALLTNNISSQQQILLESLPITTITLCLDNDDAGHKGVQNIIQKLSRMYTLKILIPNKKDLSEMNVEEVKNLFGVCQ